MVKQKSESIVKPSDCAIAFGIPVTREEFFRQLDDPENRDFVTSRCSVWSKYYRDIVAPFERVAREIERRGVKMLISVSVEEFLGLFRRDLAVIILFSHWCQDKVEFADGLVGIRSIVDGVPVEFDGIIDLCVCHPAALAAALQAERPRCLVKITNKPATPDLWLYFYRLLFKLLEESETTYLEALENTVSLFLRGSRVTDPVSNDLVRGNE